MMHGFGFTMQANPVSARKTRTVHYRAGKEPWMPIAVPSDPTLTNQEFHNGSGQSLPDFPYLRNMSDSYKVLTRKYRPRSFDDVVSQEHVISTLRNAIAQNRISHAYLFCGPRGVGKTTMARVVARMINGVSMDVDGEELGRTLDIIEIDAASNSGVDDVRSLREGVRVPPQNGTYKVYIIDEVHMLSKQAFNALLKTLEEPPPYIKFIFATTEPHKVLPTVLSRVQRFDFRRIKVTEIVDRLRFISEQEGITIDDASLHVIARKADGALRDALSIMDQAIAFCGNTIDHDALLDALNVVSNDRLFELIDCAKNHDPRRAMEIIDALLFEGHDIQEFLGALTEHLRNMYLAQDAGSMQLIEATDDEKSRLRRSAEGFTEQDLLRMMHLTSETQFRVREAQQPRIQLEMAVLRLTTMDRSEGLNQLLSEIRDLKKKLHESGVTSAGSADEAGSADSPGSADENADQAPTASPGHMQPETPVLPEQASSPAPARTTRAAKSARHELPESPDEPSPKPEVPTKNTQTDRNGKADTASQSTTVQSPDASSPDTRSATPATQASGSLLDRYLGGSAIKKSGKNNGNGTRNRASDRLANHGSAGQVNESVPENSNGAGGDLPVNGTNGTRPNEALQILAPTPDIDATDHTTDIYVEEPDPLEETVSEIQDRDVPLHELQEAWPRWLEQVKTDCAQLVSFSISRTKLLDVRGRIIQLECQDELTLQLIRQNEQQLTACFEKVLSVSLYIEATVSKVQPENQNDPYTQFKKIQQADPKVRAIVDIFGAELDY